MKVGPVALGALPPLAIKAARVAAQLALEDVGRYMVLEDLVQHAATIVLASQKARVALASGRDPAPYYAAMQPVADLFLAEVVARNHLDGMVVGIRFSSGHFVSPDSDILFLA